MTDQSGRTLRRPRLIDYAMWALVATTMVSAVRWAVSFDSPLIRIVSVGYVALGAVLLWRRWQRLR